jgi:hypothetical protein
VQRVEIRRKLFFGEIKMQKRLNHIMLLLMVVAVVMTSVIGTTTVYADDGVPPAESTEPAVDESTPPDKEETAAPVVEQPSAEEPISVPEILEQLPANTELVILNEAREVEPLATEVAAQIIIANDPVWCPGSHIPGDPECTDGASTVDELLLDISTISQINRTGPGTIFFTSNYTVSDATFTQANAALSLITDLTIQGGWNGLLTGSGYGLSGVTTFTGVPLAIGNSSSTWTGNITINDLDITGAANNAGFGLSINNAGTITLNNVSVNNTPLNSFLKGDGAVLTSTGNVDINNSQFNNNEENGLIVKTTGAIDLDTVSASGNTLTGAFLDSCRYGTVTSGLCAGNGVVTITGLTSLPTNLFNDNGFDSLVIDAGGGIKIDHVQANGNDLNGAKLTSADNNGTGNVTVDQSEFNINPNGTGLDIFADKSITLTNVDAFSNNAGAILNSTNGVGAINVSTSNFGTTNLNGNTWTGLHAESGSTIDLNNVVASYNGTNGAYLTAEGNITVTNSTFDENVHFNYPQDPGLYAKSNGGNITLTDVSADGNDYGAGAVLITNNIGVIDVIDDVTGSQFNDNGTFGIQAQSQDGDVTLDGITASYNKVKGAYLASYGLGNIFIVNNSIFVENGSYGIYTKTSQGDINLDFVTVTGDNGVDDGTSEPDNLTDYGAVLVTENGGNVLVSDSAFNLNTEVGLRIIASGLVELLNVTADQNGGNGVEVYSTYTDAPVCPGEEVVNIAVSIDGGTFTNNGDYGLMVKPGPEGTLDFVSSPDFGVPTNINDLGDFLLDLSEPSASEDCGEEEEPSEPKAPNTVEVPSIGGTPVKQDCEQFSSTILELPNGTWVNVGCPYEGYSNLEEVAKENLPGNLGIGANFVAAVTVSLTDEEGNTILNEDGSVTINFKLPEDSRGRGYSILFWDPTLNNGEGGWVEMPLYEAGTSFPLNPENPDDKRTILSGVQQIGDIITITVNFPGVFVLVSR